MVKYGRQTASVDVDTGVLLFDRKAGSFGIERVSHDRSKYYICFSVSVTFLLLANMLYNCLLACLLRISSSDCQVSEQSGQGPYGGRQPPQHTPGDDV